MPVSPWHQGGPSSEGRRRIAPLHQDARQACPRASPPLPVPVGHRVREAWGAGEYSDQLIIGKRKCPHPKPKSKSENPNPNPKPRIRYGLIIVAWIDPCMPQGHAPLTFLPLIPFHTESVPQERRCPGAVSEGARPKPREPERKATAKAPVVAGLAKTAAEIGITGVHFSFTATKINRRIYTYV